MIRCIFIAVACFWALPLPAAPIQDEQMGPDQDVVAEMVRDLTQLMRVNPRGEPAEMIASLLKRINLANRILEHPETTEDYRVFAAAAKLQAYGIRYAIDHDNPDADPDFAAEYQAAIAELLEDSDERIVFQATSANAGLAVGMFLDDATEERAVRVAAALVKLNELAPKDPQIQQSRRLLLEQVWKSGNPESVMVKLADTDEAAATIVLDQIHGKTDQETADFLWARHFAKFQDFTAIKRLARMYETGKGTRTNFSQAARWYTILSQLGDIEAQIKLADFYLAGKGYARDAKTAVELYRNAATTGTGSRLAQFKLGECYRLGQGVGQNDDNWRRWIKNAASDATPIEVQSVYRNVDFKEAADSLQIFYETLVDQNPDEIYYLNNLAFSLLIGSKTDPKRALELIDQAIEAAPEGFEGMASFVDTKAHALKHLEKWAESAKLFESILAEANDRRQVLEALIECYEQLDDHTADKYRKQLDELDQKPPSAGKGAKDNTE